MKNTLGEGRTAEFLSFFPPFPVLPVLPVLPVVVGDMLWSFMWSTSTRATDVPLGNIASLLSRENRK